MRVGTTVAEALAAHRVVPAGQAAGRVAELPAERAWSRPTRTGTRTSSPAASGSGWPSPGR
ncbi:MAG: hypothetical protein ACRDRJ_47915 [Streptosporangiaceae bacterium]